MAEAATDPSLATASTFMPGSPASVGSTTFGLPPPPRVKSSHTTPWRPLPGCAPAAGWEPAGTDWGGIPTRPRFTVSPVEWVPLVCRALPDWTRSPPRPGRAVGYSPGGRKVSTKTRPTELARPSSGFCS